MEENKNEELATAQNETPASAMMDAAKTWENKLALTVYITGICAMIIGVIASFVLASELGYYGDDLNIGVLFGGLAASFLNGILLMGFGKAIELIQGIKNNSDAMRAHFLPDESETPKQ